MSSDVEMSDIQGTEAQELTRIRYHKLLSVLDRSLSSVIDTFKLEELEKIFPALSKEIPEGLADCHGQICSYLRNSANSDFQAILMQYNMADKLTELDSLIDAAINRKLSNAEPIPEISPERINRSRAIAIKQAELERLKQTLEKVKSENESSLAYFSSLREELTNEKTVLENKIAKINEITLSST